MKKYQLTNKNITFEYLRQPNYYSIIGEVLDLTLEPDSLANFVYSINGENGTFFLKYRPPYFKTRPEIDRQQELIEYEVKAFQFIAKVMGPNRIPEMLYFDRSNFAFLTRASFNTSGVNFSSFLHQGDFDRNIEELGTQVGQLHSLTYDNPLMIKPTNIAKDYYHEQYKWLVKNVPYKNEASKQKVLNMLEVLSNKPKSTIFGDLSPKNIVVSDDHITFCDLENASAGDPEFDLGYLAGHIILEGIKQDSINTALDSIRKLLKAYKSITDRTTLQLDTNLIAMFAGTSLLYRTFAGLVPEAGRNSAQINNVIENSAEILIDIMNLDQLNK